MSIKCNRCGTTFDSPFCPNCGAPAQLQGNKSMQQLPPQMPPQIPPNAPYQQNQFRPNPNMWPPIKKKRGCLFYGLIISGSVIFLFIFSMILFSCIAVLTSNSESVTTSFNNDAVKDNPISESKITVTIAPTISPTPTTNPYIQITSTDLIAIYNENQVKCKMLYDKQLLEVTGTVESIGTDILDNTYVCLGSDTEFTFVGIQCYARNDDEINKIAELKEGNVITVRGRGDCGSMSFSIDKAEIVE